MPKTNSIPILTNFNKSNNYPNHTIPLNFDIEAPSHTNTTKTECEQDRLMNLIFMIGFFITLSLTLFCSIIVLWRCWIKEMIEDYIDQLFCCGYGEAIKNCCDLCCIFCELCEKDDNNKDDESDSSETNQQQTKQPQTDQTDPIHPTRNPMLEMSEHIPEAVAYNPNRDIPPINIIITRDNIERLDRKVYEL